MNQSNLGINRYTELDHSLSVLVTIITSQSLSLSLSLSLSIPPLSLSLSLLVYNTHVYFDFGWRNIRVDL